MNKEELYSEAERLWGKDFQLLMVIEELNELAVSLSHYLRGRIEETDVAYEMADAEIMLEQCKQILNKDITEFKKEKLDRLSKTIESYKRLHK